MTNFKTIKQVVGDTFGRVTYKPVEKSQQELIDLLNLQKREDAVRHLRSAENNAKAEAALWEGHRDDPKPMPWGNDVVGVTALIRMLAYRRPHQSKTERKFIKRWLLPLGLDQDEAGNLHCDIGHSRVLWSCHTDTVHGGSGLQRVALAKRTTLKLSKRESFSTCLGADDTAGVWLMREMILAKVPGRYVFHRGEECGGVGSMHIADNKTLLNGIDMAIALDRRGTSSVITYQGWGRCASDTFADSLADALGGNFRRDATGIFTDTANYTDIVPECTNLSVGYEDEHHKSETLWLPHIVTLCAKLIVLDTDRLVIERDPVKEAEDAKRNRYAAMDSKDWRWPSEYEKDDDLPRRYDFDDMYELVRRYPDAAADYMNQMGLSARDLEDYILELGIPLHK